MSKKLNLGHLLNLVSNYVSVIGVRIPTAVNVLSVCFGGECWLPQSFPLAFLLAFGIWLHLAFWLVS